jgi:hypothetical protein
LSVERSIFFEYEGIRMLFSQTLPIISNVTEMVCMKERTVQNLQL